MRGTVRYVVWPASWRLLVAAMCVAFMVMELVLFGAPLIAAVGTDVGVALLVVALVFAASAIVRVLSGVSRMRASESPIGSAVQGS